MNFRQQGTEPGGIIVIVVDDVVSNLAATQVGPLLMRFESYPSVEQVRARIEERLSIPLLTDNGGRRAFLSLCAHGEVESEAGSRLKFLGPQGSEAFSRLLLKTFVGHELFTQIGDKLLKTVQDGNRHSVAAVANIHRTAVHISVSTWAGRSSEVAPSLRGQWASEVNKERGHFGRQVPKLGPTLRLDYFIEDCEGSTPFSLELAASYLPLDADSLPGDLAQVALVHPMLLSDSDMRQMGLA